MSFFSKTKIKIIIILSKSIIQLIYISFYVGTLVYIGEKLGVC